MTDIHNEWVKYPTGKIPPGEWCDTCGRYNTRNVTCAVIPVFQNKILLIRRQRDPQAGWWCLPGGYLNWNETVEECAARELKEETGLSVNSLKLNRIYSSPTRDLDGRQNVDCNFIAEVTSDTLHPEQSEVSEYKWFSFNEIPSEIAFDHGQMIQDYLSSLTRS